MNPPEQPPRIPQNTPEQLNGREKFEAVLSLFGTDEARGNFVRLCRDYTEARANAVTASYSPEVSVRRTAIISNLQQAALHNRIMDALTRIASQAPAIAPLTPTQQSVLREMHDREVTVKIIREYISLAPMPKEEEEEGGTGNGKKGGMSDIAHYRLLNKGG